MRRSTDGDMNPLVKVAVALIIGMTLGRYGATAVPLWSWSAMAALCLAIVLFSVGQLVIAFGCGFGRRIAYGGYRNKLAKEVHYRTVPLRCRIAYRACATRKSDEDRLGNIYN